MPPRKTAAAKAETEVQEPEQTDHVAEDEMSVFAASSEEPMLLAEETEPVSESEPEPASEVKEELTLEDLVFDHGKVKAQLNLFPVTVDGLREQRLFIVEVPGEEGTTAALWYRSTQTGPELAYPIRRVSILSTGVFTLEDNSDHVYEKDSGCGCGNQLKGWNGPWDGYVRIVQTRVTRL